MKEMCLFPKLFRKPDLGFMILRIALAIAFIVHGYLKLANLDGTAKFFEAVGIPAAAFMAGVVAVIELAGGIAVLIGFLTRQAAALLAIDMIVAICVVTKGSIPYLEMMILAGALTLLFTGSGKWSIMHG